MKHGTRKGNGQSSNFHLDLTSLWWWTLKTLLFFLTSKKYLEVTSELKTAIIKNSWFFWAQWGRRCRCCIQKLNLSLWALPLIFFLVSERISWGFSVFHFNLLWISLHIFIFASLDDSSIFEVKSKAHFCGFEEWVYSLGFYVEFRDVELAWGD